MKQIFLATCLLFSTALSAAAEDTKTTVKPLTEKQFKIASQALQKTLRELAEEGIEMGHIVLLPETRGFPPSSIIRPPAGCCTVVTPDGEYDSCEPEDCAVSYPVKGIDDVPIVLGMRP